MEGRKHESPLDWDDIRGRFELYTKRGLMRRIAEQIAGYPTDIRSLSRRKRRVIGKAIAGFIREYDPDELRQCYLIMRTLDRTGKGK